MLALVACDGKIDMDAANAARASPRTLFRWAERLKTEGHFRPRKHSGGPERKMDEDDALFLWCGVPSGTGSWGTLSTALRPVRATAPGALRHTAS